MRRKQDTLRLESLPAGVFATSGKMRPSSAYVWGTGLTEQQRLLQQVELYAPEAHWLLDQLNIMPGSRAIDLGCGPLGILDLLSERVGPRGEGLGVESEPRFVDLAKRLVEERQLQNVQVLLGDATATGLPDKSFQFVHERLLLIVVPDATKVICEMVRLVEPGGAVAVQEVDVATWECEPSHPAWTRLFQVFATVYSLDGKDLRVGRRLPGLLRAAGLQNVGYKVHARVNGPADFHQQQLLVFIKLFWQRIIELELAAESELKSLFEQLEAHLADPGTIVVSPLLFQAWGYRDSARVCDQTRR
jgi:SAM-dependent methyltransferase